MLWYFLLLLGGLLDRPHLAGSGNGEKQIHWTALMEALKKLLISQLKDAIIPILNICSTSG